MRNLDPQRAKWIRIRMGFLCALMAMTLGIVVNGAYHIEVEDGAEWFSLAERQRQRRLHIAPKRGTIYDRNGTPLAESVEVPSVSVDAVELLRGIDEQYIPMRIEQYAQRIGAALDMPPEKVATKLARRRRFAWLKRRISEEEVAAIRALSDRSQRYPVRGLIIEGEGRRFYPNRQLAGPLLGFVSPDGEGKDGLELSLNHELKGLASQVKGLRDRNGRLIFSEGLQNEQALAGHNVYLTIDKAIQFTAERELEAALNTYEAIGGSVVVMEPQTGHILALANAPGFNPNDYRSSDPAHRRNRALVDRFEPGSTMKMFTVAAGLAAGTITPKDTIYCEEGRMPIDNIVIHDTHVHKWLTPAQVLSVSSNIGAAKIGLGLGQKRLYEGFRRFGFGDAPGVPVPGEAVGVLRPRHRPWVQVETASAAFGQGISVTTMQLAMAMGALANGGKLLQPTLIARVTDGTGVVLQTPTARVRRQAVPPRVARLVSEMLVSVTEGEGTGTEAAIPGFRVAGKTATAQKIDPATGRYTDTHYVASFVGMVPARRPRLVIAVTIDEPLGGTYAGGAVAAPVFRRVGDMALRYLGVTPRGSKPMKLSEVSALARDGDPAESAYAALSEEEPSDEAPVVGGGKAGAHEAKVPDLSGMPTREAVKTVVEAGFDPRVEGTGRLTRQEPAPGSVLPRGSMLTLIFEPPT